MTATLKVKNGVYYAVINYKQDEQYKQKWVSTGIRERGGKRKALEALEEIRREFEYTLSTPNGDILFADYIRIWLESKRDKIELSTWERYESYAKRHIIPYYNSLGLTIREVKPRHIKEYYDAKYVGGRLDGKSGGLSIASLKGHGIVLKEALNAAVLADIIPRNPAIGVKLPAKENKTTDRVFLTADQANKLLVSLEGHPLQPLVYVTLYYGLRRSEVCGLKWSAIDFERNTLSINHTVVKNRTIVRKDKTKTSSSRHTYELIDDVKKVLAKLKEAQLEAYKAFGLESPPNDYVFTWADGTPFRPDYVTRGFQRALKRNGLPVIRFHDLRHSTASILYDLGWSIKDIQLWLRHSSVEVTADIYTHISNERKSKMASSFNNTLKM